MSQELRNESGRIELGQDSECPLSFDLSKTGWIEVVCKIVVG